MAKRKCTRCGKQLPATLKYFYKKRNGLNARCKTCVAASKPHSGDKPGPKRIRVVGQCNRCKVIYPNETEEYFYLARRRGRIEVRSICKKCFDKQQHEYNEKNIEAIRSYNKRRAKTPHHRAIMRKAWRRYHAKPEYKTIDRAQYLRTVSTNEGRERIRIKCRKRRARQKGSMRHHTVEDIMFALEIQEYKCFYCSTDVSTNYTVDHLVPLVRRGSDGPENIVIACANCNFRKSSKTPKEFLDYCQQKE